MDDFTEQQIDWLQRIYDVAFDASQSQELALSMASKLYNQTKLNPNYNRPDGQGIAALPEGLEIDTRNPEESINYAVERDLQVYNETGDIQAAIADSFITDENDDEAVRNALRSIQESIPAVQEALSGDNATFTSIESQENRFRQANRLGDVTGQQAVVGELINERVAERANA